MQKEERSGVVMHTNVNKCKNNKIKLKKKERFI
jgi:hypothetical protein